MIMKNDSLLENAVSSIQIGCDDMDKFREVFLVLSRKNPSKNRSTSFSGRVPIPEKPIPKELALRKGGNCSLGFGSGAPVPPSTHDTVSC